MGDIAKQHQYFINLARACVIQRKYSLALVCLGQAMYFGWKGQEAKQYYLDVNPEITDIVREIALIFSWVKKFKKQHPKNEKIKLGYLTEGFDSGQAPIKNLINLARYHDKELFDITFYSRFGLNDGSLELPGFKNYAPTIKLLEDLDCKVRIRDTDNRSLNRVLRLYKDMQDDNIDILCTYVMYTIPVMHLLCALKPAPILVKDVYQQAEYSDLPDLTIHYGPRHHHDIGNKAHISQRWPHPKVKKVFTKSDFGIPESATVLISIIRDKKIINDDFMSCVDAVLKDQPNVYFVAIGWEGKSSNHRIINLGFREDVFDVLQIGDIYLDSFPLGGGMALAEAIFAELPVVMFEANEGPFAVHLTTVPEILDIPELTIKRWWRGNWVNKVKQLINDKDYYNQMKAKIIARGKELDRYEDFIKEKEEALLKIYNQKMEAINGCKT